MKLKLRCSDDGKQFGFVEKYSPYYYLTGAVSIMALVNAGDYFSKPYVMRKGEFIPLSQIEEEMGIEKYLKAKKPFYSVLGEGNLIVDMKVAFDLNTHEYLKDKSDFKMYGVVKGTLSQDDKNTWNVELRRLTSSNAELDKWLNSLANDVAKFGDNREAFLKSRFI